MAPLLVLLARQTSLKHLNMHKNNLSASQTEQIRKVVSENAPECNIDMDNLAMRAMRRVGTCCCSIF